MRPMAAMVLRISISALMHFGSWHLDRKKYPLEKEDFQTGKIPAGRFWLTVGGQWGTLRTMTKKALAAT